MTDSPEVRVNLNCAKSRVGASADAMAPRAEMLASGEYIFLYMLMILAGLGALFLALCEQKQQTSPQRPNELISGDRQ
jgi:hypothetical protein